MKIQTERVSDTEEIDVKSFYSKGQDIVRRFGKCSLIKIFHKNNGTKITYQNDKDKEGLPSFCFVNINDEFLDPYPQPSPIYYTHICIQDLNEALNELGYEIKKLNP